MRRTNLLARATLALALTCSSGAFLSGCDDEADPKTWVKKLNEPARRTGAMQRLHRLFDEALASSRPPDARAPRVRAFLDKSLEGISRAFITNSEDTLLRRDAIEILAQSQDPRAIDALLSALNFRAGVPDAERVALRATQALKEMAANIPADKRIGVINGLVAGIDRATGNGSNMVQIRYHALGALGALHATEAVDSIVRLLSRRLAEQDISTARAAADALGVIGDPRGVDALIYGLFLNLRAQNAFPHCQRALARIGAQHAVPKLLATLGGQNAQVETLLGEYRAIANGPPVPDGFVKSTMADVLREFASPDAVQPLLTLMGNREEPENVRAAAAEALAYTALSNPSQKDAIVRALHAAFTADRGPSEAGWSALTYASKLSLVGDPTSVPLVLAALTNRAAADVQYSAARAGLLLAFTSLARHDNVADFDRIEGELRGQFNAAMAQDEDSAPAIRAQIATLDKLKLVITVARTCNDGDTACYIRALDGTTTEAVRKAAYMLAWTTPEAQRAQALAALTAKVNHSDLLVRRSIMVAIDALSPVGTNATATITRLRELIRSEEGQESKILSHLWAELLIARLTSRAAAH